MTDTSFEIELRKSGRLLQVPADKSILQVLLENGIYVMTSCETGVCGTCITPLLAGEADHRDEYLLDDEKAANNQIAVCVSRSKGGRLVLDL